MPRTLSSALLRTIHILVTASVILGLCTPAIRPTRVLAANLAAGAAAQARPLSAPQAEGPAVALDVQVEPPEARPGQLVTVTVRVKAEAGLPEATLTATLAPGLGFDSAEGEGVRFDAAARGLQWAPGQVKAGQVWRFRLRVQDDAADVMRLRVALQAGDGGLLAAGEAVVKRPFPPVEARITPGEGGVLKSADGRVQVTFPKGATDRPLRVEQRPRRAEPMPAREPGIALEFEVNATTDDAAASPAHHFSKPLELRVDLSGLVNLDALAYYQYPFVGYQDDTGKWIPLPTRREGQVLIAQIDHLTVIGAGTGVVNQAGWLLTFNDATVSPFSGGLSYDYPIAVPAGRGGLTPDLHLNYNSRRVDGILTWTQADWAGLGWSIDTMEIARKVMPGWDSGSGSPAWCWEWIDYTNEFTLLYNGTGYTLRAGSSNPYGRYYTTDEQFLYIERRNTAGGNGSPSNQTSEYWIVRLRDGSEYRLGYNNDSEQTFHSQYWSGSGAKYAGDQSPDVTYRWRVDRVQDLRGNRIEFSYDEPPENSNPGGGYRERASYLTQVRYNYIGSTAGSRVNFLRAARGGRDGGYMIGNGDCWFSAPFYQDDYLATIQIQSWDAGSQVYRTVREYGLGYTMQVRSDTCYTRLLASIQQRGTDGSTLPATTFAYTSYDNKGKCINNCPDQWHEEGFGYGRLSYIDNGYGGVITAPSYSTYDTYGDAQAWNYHVNEQVVSDGRGGGYRIAYSYGSPTATAAMPTRTTPNSPITSRMVRRRTVPWSASGT